ncbi:MAG TPA: BTAD domain-containing putative transcriptional regulator [Longimicrobium sp.]|jgi:serine/threonine-protein kinase
MLRLTTLGTLRLERDGAPVPAPQPKRVALLAYLALAHPRGPHRRDSLLGMFWPELPEERARNALRQALHQLRAACGDGVLATRGMHEVGIDPARVRCDVHELEAAAARGDAAAVAAAYGGDLLPGLFAAGAGEWEDWLARERMRLRSLAAEAGRALAHAARDAGDAAAAARWARWTCGLDPLDEAAVRWAMELLAGCGLRGAALELFERLAAQMRRELGVEPGEETAAAAEAVRAAAPTARRAPARPVVRVATPPPALAGSRVEAPRASMWALGRARVRWAAAGVLLAGTVAAVAADGLGGPRPRRERVAVLPFRPAGAAPADAAAAREAADRVRGALAAAGLEVASGDGGDAAAGTVVSGALYRRGSATEVRATVSDALAGSEVASLGALLPAGDTAALAALSDRVLAVVATHADPVFGWVGPTSRPAGSPGYRPFVEGLRALRDERGDDAAALFRTAAQADTGFVLAALMAAGIDAEQGRRAAADSAVRRLAPGRAALAPADRTILEWIERTLAGDRAGALAAMRELTTAAPGLEMGHFQAGLEAVRCNRPAEALRHLARIDPERGFSRGWASYWATRADALHMLGRHADELRHLRRGLALHPELVVLRDYELRALAALGRTGEVLRRIDEYAAIPARGGWSPSAAMLHAARELRAHGHDAAARSAFRRGVAAARARAAAAPADPGALAELAGTLYAARLDADAERVLDRLAALEPRCAGCLGARGVLAARAGDRAGALRADAELALRPPKPGGLLWRARIAAALDDRRGAAALVREAVARGYAYDGLTHTDAELGPLFP